MCKFTTVPPTFLAAFFTIAMLHCNQPAEEITVYNIALNKPSIASSSYTPDTGPEKAVDGDTITAWNSGKYHPAFLEIDLQGTFSVMGIALKLNQSPAGKTAFQAWVVTGTDTSMAARWVGETKIGSQLDTIFMNPLRAIHKVRIVSEASPSWISFLEVTVSGSPE